MVFLRMLNKEGLNNMNIIYFVVNRRGTRIPFKTLKNANAFLNSVKRNRYFVSHKVVSQQEYNDIFTDIVE